MKRNIGLRKAALFGLICASVVFCNMSNTKQANASTVNPVSTPAVTSGTQSEKSSNLYPIHVVKDGNDLYGYIDETGSVVIKPSYAGAGNFSEGLAVVNKDETFLVINTKGKVILRSKNYINDFHNGLASFSDSKTYNYGYINKEGKVVLKAAYNFAGNFGKDHTAIVSKSGKYYRINSKGKILNTYSLPTKNAYYDMTDDGYAIYNSTSTFLKGVKDINGKTILKTNYSEITYLGNGLFGVKKKLAADEGYLVSVKPSAIFDKNGKQLTPFKYYDLSGYNNNYASFTDSKYTYLIDKKGNVLSSFPKQEGRGTLTVLGDVVQADIDNKISYFKMDGTSVWKNAETTALPSGITVQSAKVKPNKYVVVYYPKLEGLADTSVQKIINNKLERLFTADRMKLTLKDNLMVDDNFSVEQIKDLLIIRKTGYDDYFGSAHGTPLLFYYFIDTKTGTFYQFKDLFKKDSKYIKTLDNIARKQMKEQEKKDGMSYNNVDGTYVTEKQFFYLSKDALTLYFDSGAIAPYAAGFPQFNIPFSDIDNLINKGGAFWKSFQE